MSDEHGEAPPTVVGAHKWAAKVGQYNNDPIWEEIFQHIQENRRQSRSDLQNSVEAARQRTEANE